MTGSSNRPSAALISILGLISSIFLFARVSLGEPRISIGLEPQQGAITDTFYLSVGIVLTGDEKIGELVFGSHQFFSLTPVGTSKSHQFINGQQSSSVDLSFAVKLKQRLAPGRYTLPNGQITIDGRTYNLTPPPIQIVNPEDRQQGTSRSGVKPSSSDLRVSQSVSDTRAFVGQQILYQVEISPSSIFAGGSLDQVDMPGFWKESLGDQRESVQALGQEDVRSVREVFFPTEHGQLTIPARSLIADVKVAQNRRLQRGMNIFDDMFSPSMGLPSFMNTDRRRYITNAITLNVRPLPPLPTDLKGRDDKGYVPVGNLTIESAISRDSIAQGESTSLVIRIQGDANLRPLELGQPEGDNLGDFRFYADKPQVTVEPKGSRVNMTKVFTISLVALEPGRLSVPRYRFRTFDPQSETYRDLTTNEFFINVQAVANPARMVVSSASGVNTASGEPKVAIDVSGEDLLAQHVGPDVLRPNEKLQPQLVGYVIFGIPILSLTLVLYVYWVESKKSNPTMLRKRNALKLAKSRIQQLSQRDDGAFDVIHHSLIEFIRDRMNISSAYIGPRQVSDMIQAEIPEAPELASSIEDLLTDLERMRYAGQPSNADPAKTSVHLFVLKALKQMEAIDERLKDLGK